MENEGRCEHACKFLLHWMIALHLAMEDWPPKGVTSLCKLAHYDFRTMNACLRILLLTFNSCHLCFLS